MSRNDTFHEFSRIGIATFQFFPSKSRNIIFHGFSRTRNNNNIFRKLSKPRNEKENLAKTQNENLAKTQNENQDTYLY